MSYKIQSGDTLGKLAAQNNVSMQDILNMNPEITDPNRIFVGQDIILPEQGDELVSLENPLMAKPSSPLVAIDEEPVQEENNALVNFGKNVLNFFIPSADANQDVPVKEAKATAEIALSQNPLDAAQKYLGINEKDEEGAEAVRQFFDNAVGSSWLKGVSNDAAAAKAWCAAFVTQVLSDSGVDMGKDFKNIRTQELVNMGTPVSIDQVKVGDVMIKEHTPEERKKYKLGYGHAGIVSKIEDGEVFFVGGNTGDAVRQSSYNMNDAKLTFRRFGEAPEAETSNFLLDVENAAYKARDAVKSWWDEL